mmetsp:Transcript_10718/g.22910  ORF Transcript_10718/g.22910 Transcript_10718/m.22910 type:complete len:292 (-) Transcript_10718:49-924(-)
MEGVGAGEGRPAGRCAGFLGGVEAGADPLDGLGLGRVARHGERPPAAAEVGRDPGTQAHPGVEDAEVLEGDEDGRAHDQHRHIQRLVHKVVPHHRLRPEEPAGRAAGAGVAAGEHGFEAGEDRIDAGVALVRRPGEIRVGGLAVERRHHANQLDAHADEILVRERGERRARGRPLRRRHRVRRLAAMAQPCVEVPCNGLRLGDTRWAPLQHGEHAKRARYPLVVLHVHPVSAGHMLEGNLLIHEIDSRIRERIPKRLSTTPALKISEHRRALSARCQPPSVCQLPRFADQP